jgi:predicted outer membrane repeat protein
MLCLMLLRGTCTHITATFVLGLHTLGISIPTPRSCLISVQVEASHCKFHGNWAGKDGAVSAADASSLRISQCSFIGNTATKYGAAILCGSSSKVPGEQLQYVVLLSCMACIARGLNHALSTS